MDKDANNNALARLKRIAGQITGIQRMVTEERNCLEVMIQIAAVQAALMETGRVILSAHFEHGMSDALRSRDPLERRKKIDQLMDFFSRFCRVDGETSSKTP